MGGNLLTAALTDPGLYTNVWSKNGWSTDGWSMTVGQRTIRQPLCLYDFIKLKLYCLIALEVASFLPLIKGHALHLKEVFIWKDLAVSVQSMNLSWHRSRTDLLTVAETWHQVWGDGIFFSRTKISEWRYFSEKNLIFTAKISDDLFLVSDQVFRIFPFFYQIFRIFTMLNVLYDPFLTKNTFLTLFILSCASDNTTSQKIRGRMHGPSPNLEFVLGGRPPSPPSTY